jgi:hypothetical protein
MVADNTLPGGPDSQSVSPRFEPWLTHFLKKAPAFRRRCFFVFSFIGLQMGRLKPSLLVYVLFYLLSCSYLPVNLVSNIPSSDAL